MLLLSMKKEKKLREHASVLQLKGMAQEIRLEVTEKKSAAK